MEDSKAVTLWSKVEGVDKLAQLALDLHWTWNHAADELWKRLDADIWNETQNPWVILRTVSADKIKAQLGDPVFCDLLDNVLKKNRLSYTTDAWFQEAHPRSSLSLTAYFSMEFMLTEALPIYSGGLGNVAGDQMKAASDLGVPIAGIGLLYGQGYFRQDFDSEGNQRALFPVNDPGELPIRPLRGADGDWIRFQLRFPGRNVWIRCWEATIGRNKLYLLDTNDFANTAAQRGITSELYGGDVEMRLRQEFILGIGGWTLLRKLGLKPEVCHLNEGHAALAVLERARAYMEDFKTTFDVALTVTRAGNLFTTHTAVSAGFDRFSPELMTKYFGSYAKEELGISVDSLLALGRRVPGNVSEPFNMAYLAIHASGQSNAVSKLHGEVSRQLFQPLFPRYPQFEVPIGSVTNGIHVPTWDSPEADALWTQACGKERWRGSRPTTDGIRALPDNSIWQMRHTARRQLVECIRKRYAVQLSSEGKDSSLASNIFRDDVFTLGFARRFATYKRPNLLLHDPERFVRLLTSQERPIQLIIAGKAHPQDLPGQALVRQWNDFIQRPDVQGHVVFLSDYDMFLAQELVRGVDLWINTPRRPWEACGTSGMKILVNGGLNLSERDGWWAEAYRPEVGWAIGDGKEHGDDMHWDASEAAESYDLLETEIVPEFYDRNHDNPPVRWLGRVRESMASLTVEFSAGRAVREYTESFYLPAAASYCERATDASKLGSELSQWQRNIESAWESVHFGEVSCETHGEEYLFTATLFLGTLNPADICPEIYADPIDGLGSCSQQMSALTGKQEKDGGYAYSGRVHKDRPANAYTVRVVPLHRKARVPLESNRILWQR